MRIGLADLRQPFLAARLGRVKIPSLPVNVRNYRQAPPDEQTVTLGPREQQDFCCLSKPSVEIALNYQLRRHVEPPLPFRRFGMFSPVISRIRAGLLRWGCRLLIV